jgi:hypothetical protein
MTIGLTQEQKDAIANAKANTSAPMAGVSTAVITFSNAGTILAKVAGILLRTNGTAPTPAQVGLDNSVVQVDNETNYGWAIREGMKIYDELTGSKDIAKAGHDVEADFQGKHGKVNQFGEFTPDGETNPNE